MKLSAHAVHRWHERSGGRPIAAMRAELAQAKPLTKKRLHEVSDSVRAGRGSARLLRSPRGFVFVLCRGAVVTVFHLRRAK